MRGKALVEHYMMGLCLFWPANLLSDPYTPHTPPLFAKDGTLGKKGKRGAKAAPAKLPADGEGEGEGGADGAAAAEIKKEGGSKAGSPEPGAAGGDEEEEKVRHRRVPRHYP
jgi:hypothetical protein